MAAGVHNARLLRPPRAVDSLVDGQSVDIGAQRNQRFALACLRYHAGFQRQRQQANIALSQPARDAFRGLKFMIRQFWMLMQLASPGDQLVR